MKRVTAWLSLQAQPSFELSLFSCDNDNEYVFWGYLMNHHIFSTSLRLSLATLLVSVSLVGHASDSERITQLEREVQELKQRLSKIESTQQTQPKPPATNSTDGWKQISNWRSLKRSMSFDQVRAILGEPSSIRGGAFTSWDYSNRGSVTFYKERLDMWSEPR